MIWIGRIIAMPLGLLLLVLLLLTLFTLQVSDTFLKPSYYTEQLVEADIYEFALNDLLTSALNEARDLDASEFSVDGNSMEENPIVTSGLSTERIVQAINRAVPPEYLQDLVEQSFDQFGGYLTAERDEFELTLRAGEQVAIMVDEVKLLLEEADAYNLLFDEAIEPEVRRAGDFELPLGAEASPDRLVQAARNIVTAEWAQQLVENTLDQVTSYMTGKSDTFEVGIDLSDRIDIALEEVKGILRDMGAVDLLYDQVVEPTVLDSLGDGVDLAFGVSVSETEVLGALREVAPSEWVEEQVDLVIDAAGPYLAGRTDSFNVEISLVENKRMAGGIIEDMVAERLTTLIDTLPTCRTVAEAVAATRGGTGLPPACVPPNVSLNELIDASRIDIGDTVQRSVLGQIPNTVSFSEARIISALNVAGARDNVELLDKFRGFLRDGCIYTERDLVRPRPEGSLCPSLYDENISDGVEDVRSFLSEGFTYTHIDFRHDLQELDEDYDAGAALAPARDELLFIPDNEIEILDLSRNWLSWTRDNKWIFYLPLVMLLVIIGFLGGRGWWGRLMWPASFLLITSAIVVVAAGPGWEIVTSGELDEQRAEAIEELNNDANTKLPSTSRLALDKGFDLAESVADDFASGIRTSAITLAFIAIAAIAATVFKNTIVAGISSITRDIGKKDD
jgi:hypothetical protein